MKTMRTGIGMAALLVSMSSLVSAQEPSGSASTALSKFQQIWGQKTMSARVVMTASGSERAGNMGPMEFDVKMSKGNVRMEMDMAKMAAGAGGGSEKGMPPGMGKMITITRPDKKVIYQVMPEMNAYYEMPLTNTASEKAEAAKIARKVEGSEKVDTYTCDKIRNTITTPEGTQSDVMTWEAKELSGLPVKVEMTTSHGTLTMLYKDIKTDAIAASLFEPPTGATKYGSMQELMMQNMMKMMQQGQK